MSFSQWLYDWWTGFVVMAGGAVFVWLSLSLLREYQRAFMTDPMSVMSLDMLLSILRCGTPAVMALMCLMVGALFMAGGFVLIVYPLFSSLAVLWQALRFTLGV